MSNTDPTFDPAVEKRYFDILIPGMATGDATTYAEWNGLRAELNILNQRYENVMDQIFDDLHSTGVDVEELEEELDIPVKSTETAEHLVCLVEAVSIDVHKLELARAIELGLKDVADWLALHITISEEVLKKL